MEFLEIFFQELHEKGQAALELIKRFLQERDKSVVNELYRIFHTIKGSASLVGLSGFRDLMHRFEDYFKRYEAGAFELTDDFLARMLAVIPTILERNADFSESEVAEIVDVVEGRRESSSTVVRERVSEEFTSMLTDFISKALSVENSLMRGDYKNALRGIRSLKNSLNALLEEGQYVKLQDLLKNFDILVVQEATMNKKKVRLNLEVGAEKVERRDSQVLLDMLVHLVRNAIAHGVEPPDVRVAIGKDEFGRITIRSYVQNNELHLEIEDDGAGIDFAKVRRKALEKGLGNLPPEEVIFVPGFSTKDEADKTAGRGVGLDVVKSFAIARGGDVELLTRPGQGTKFIIHFPVRSFLLRVLVVEADDYKFAISTHDVLEVLTKPTMIVGKVKHGDRLFEIVYSSKNPRFCVVSRSHKALLVDGIVGTFDGQVSGETYGYIQGFVKNIFVYPLPIIDVDRLPKLVSEAGRRRKILIIDDSFVTRSVVAKFLKTFGFDVLEADSGEHGVNVVKSDPSVDLVLCDLEMPGIDGFETTERLKKAKPELPVVIFSSLSEEQLRRGLEVGADAYLAKTEPPERIVALVERLVGAR